MLEPDSSDIMGKGWHLFLVLTLSNKKLQYASQDLENKSIHSRRKLISGSIWKEPFLLFAICKVSCNIFLLHKNIIHLIIILRGIIFSQQLIGRLKQMKKGLNGQRSMDICFV